MSTYREIMGFATAMQNESTLTKRREAGRQLEQRVTSARIRHELALEAGHNRKEGLEELWRFIIQNGIAYVEKLANSKSKLTQGDILLVFSLIKCCDLLDESMTPEEIKYQGYFRLTRKEVKQVLVFCLNFLDDDEALQVAELDLLDMLSYISASRGYMSFIRSQNEIKNILLEVDCRISDDALSSRAIREKAAEIFQNLCTTAVHELGIDFSTLIASSLKMVADWCLKAYQRATQQTRDGGVTRSCSELYPLIDGLTTTMLSNPEQTIAPLTRHGRAIFRLAKKHYRTVADRNHRHVLNRYFLCHLIVAQTAAEFRGLMPGDLADLGEATLTPRQIDDLLQLVMARCNELSVSLRGAADLETTPFDEIQRTHLELTARLLACAQRIALCHLEHNKIKDLASVLTDMIKGIPKTDDLPRVDHGTESFAPTAESVVAETPFMQLILKGLYQGAMMVLAGRPGRAHDQYQKHDQLPIIKALAATSIADYRTAADRNTAKTWLPIIAACSELFPMGACWASRSLSCWFEISNKAKIDHRRYVHGCDAMDLAAVVSVVTSVLDAHGDHAGDAECQKWALRCVTRLAKTTSCLLLFDNNCNSCILGKAWQEMWVVLFRSDLRYSAYTGHASPDSVGEWVLVALSAIVSSLCTDPKERWSQDVRERRSTFLYRQQGDIWNLPAFSLVGEFTSLLPFDLIVVLLETVGLNEGPDSVSQGLKYKGLQLKTVPDESRRHRLINFCLSKIGSSDAAGEIMIGAAATSIAALLHGRESGWSKSLRSAVMMSPSVVNMPDRPPSRKSEMNVFAHLWTSNNSLLPSIPKKATTMRDPVSSCVWNVEISLRYSETALGSADILASSTSRRICNSVAEALTFSSDLTPTLDGPELFHVMFQSTKMLKINMAAFLCRSKGSLLDMAFDRLSTHLANILRIVTNNATAIVKNCSRLLWELRRIVEFFVQVSSSERLDLPHIVLDNARDLAEELEKHLALNMRDETSFEEEEHESRASARALDLDADDIDEKMNNEDTLYSRKRPREPNDSPRKRSRLLNPSGLPTGQAMDVAALLFALKPTLETVRLASEKLLGVDLDRSIKYYDSDLVVDPILAASLTQLFSPLLRENVPLANTGAALLYRLIRMTRHNSPPHSPLHLFGYEECAHFCTDDGWEGLREQSKSDANELLMVWTELDPTELRSRTLRPFLRVAAANTMTTAFVGGDSTIKTQWEKTYPSQILPLVVELNGQLRILGAHCVASSLAAMARQEKVISSILRNLPPVSGDKRDLKDWYTSMAGNSDLTLQQAWEDVRDSIEFVTLLSMSLVGGSCSARAQQESILFEIITVARDRSDLEAACFVVTDLFAKTSGFSSAEDMISAFLHGLVGKWLDKPDTEGVLALPLLFSAPTLLRFLAANSSFCTWQEDKVRYEYIRHHAANEFFHRNQSIILPRLLESLSKPTQPDQRLRDFCSIYRDEEEESKIIQGLVRKNISSLDAHCSVQSCLSLVPSNLSEAINFYVEENELSQLRKRHASSTARSFIQQASSIFGRGAADDKNLAQRVAEKFVELSGGGTEVNPFRNVGLTLSECCITSRAWVHSSASVSWIIQWKIQTIQILWAICCVCTELQRADSQLDFLLFLFSELYSNSMPQKLLSYALLLLKDVMYQLLTPEMNPNSLSRDFGSKVELRVLFCSVWRLYEFHIYKLLNHSYGATRVREVLKRRACGLGAQSFLSFIDESGNFGEAGKPAADAEPLDQEILYVLDILRELLQLFAGNCCHLGLNCEVDLDPIMDACISEEDLSKLESLGHKFFSRGEGIAPHAAPDFYRKLVSSSSFIVPSNGTRGDLSPHQHLLVSDLKELFSFLSDGNTEYIISADRPLLLEKLTSLCFDSPRQISATASRCIGALQRAGLDEQDFASITHAEISSTQDGKLEAVLEARCLSILMEVVKSPKVYSALIAMETIKGLLSTKAAMERGELSSTLLAHFVPSRKTRITSLVLEQRELKKIKELFVNKETCIEWCWDEPFWVSCLNCDFDKWICQLVPSILSCHYTERGTTEPGKLLCCQRMSCIDPHFASSLFPLLILQLLCEQQSNKVASLSEVQCETWIGDPGAPIAQKISKCFSGVFQECNKRAKVSDSRAVGLLVDTLDMIRRLEQDRFSMSNAHTRNPTSLKSFKVGGTSSNPPSQGTPPSQPQDYFESFEPVKWTGIPFGVGLFVSGIQLAEVCCKVKRYFSGLFYAEHYADVRFGGSTRNIRTAIEELSQNPGCMTSDISGFPPEMCPTKTSVDAVSLLQEAKNYLQVMVECSKALNDRDLQDAVTAELSAVGLMGDNFTKQPAQGYHLPPAEMLTLHDSSMMLAGMVEQKKAVLDSLSRLHLFGTLQASIEGLVTRPSNEDNFGDTLRDKWFEGCLFGNSLVSLSAGSSGITSRLSSSSNQSAGFCESIFTALQCFLADDDKICRIHAENARLSTIEDIADFAATEASSIASISLVDKLNCLNDLEFVVKKHGMARDFPESWKLNEDTSPIFARSFSYATQNEKDRPFSARVQELVLQRIATKQGESGCRAKKFLSSLLWQSADKSCRHARIVEAQTAFQRLFAIHGSDTSKPDFFKVRHLEARILEVKGDFSSAIRHATQSLGRLEHFPLSSENNEIRADLLLCCGRWMSSHRVDSGENVLEKYLKPGLILARRINNDAPSVDAARRVTEACLTLGDLVFNIYETVSARVKSPEWKTAGASLKAREAECLECEMVAKSQNQAGTAGKKGQKDPAWDEWLKDLMVYKINLSKDVQQIRSEREKITRSIDDFKEQALKTYIEALSIADDSYGPMSKYVYRIFGMLFSAGVTYDDPAAFDRIPSYRFVSLSNQLFSRLTQHNLPLKQLAKRLCFDHPYHCLAQMVRLSISNASESERDKEKAAVAIDVLDHSKAKSPEFLLLLIENYQLLVQAYVVLSEASTDQLRKSSKRISFSAVYKGNVNRLDQCLGKGSRRRPCPPCVLTKPPLLRPRGDYGSGVDDPVGGERIDKFDDHFSVAESGITRPKIVVCIGSKGGRYKQLVKGGDDCRGDAVMEQVFEYVNALFAHQKTARDNNMRIITYTIVPTSPTSGVLEWVEDTLPFGDFLNDRGKKGSAVGAHSRYYPGEWGSYLCREYLKNATRNQKRQAFETICKMHSPVFRFFFVERFRHSAHEWYKAKARYTRSVAVASFVGHILGIGDRHSNNILVHQRTGEVVHIDFGIVFEQGKLLQVPERVPFRLTQNVVDGFGPTGTNGMFTTASRQTLEALKQNADSLLTILSAITADPLYKWSLNPKVERKCQEMLGKMKAGPLAATKNTDISSGDQNETATQAVRKVKEKLSGYEDGTAGEQQSVEGQVHFLINSARDPEYLCQMYPGWAPWS